jgi:hypothetical protein
VKGVAQCLIFSMESNTFYAVIPAYNFASTLVLSKSKCPCGAKAGIHFVFND